MYNILDLSCVASFDNEAMWDMLFLFQSLTLLENDLPAWLKVLEVLQMLSKNSGERLSKILFMLPFL